MWPSQYVYYTERHCHARQPSLSTNFGHTPSQTGWALVGGFFVSTRKNPSLLEIKLGKFELSAQCSTHPGSTHLACAKLGEITQKHEERNIFHNVGNAPNKIQPEARGCGIVSFVSGLVWRQCFLIYFSGLLTDLNNLPCVFS